MSRFSFAPNAVRAVAVPFIAVLGVLSIVGTSNAPASCVAQAPELSVTEVDFTVVSVSNFLPFGYELSPGVLNPAYELRLAPTNAAVRAVTAGIVEAIEVNDQGDFEIRVRAGANSCYLVIYDHVQNVTVAVGNDVVAGQTLGQVGLWNESTGRTELQINNESVSPTVAMCPESLGTELFNTAHSIVYGVSGHGGTGVCWQDTVQP